jgi:hypothetical protein
MNQFLKKTFLTPVKGTSMGIVYRYTEYFGTFIEYFICKSKINSPL